MAGKLYGLTQNDHNKIAEGLRKLGGGKGVPSRRPTANRRRTRDGGTVGDSLIAKITATVSARVGDAYGSLANVDLGHVDSGSWSEVLADQTVYNPSLSPLHVPSGESIHIVANKVRGSWVLAGPFDPHQAKGYDESKDQSLGHDAADSSIDMQDDGDCD